MPVATISTSRALLSALQARAGIPSIAALSDLLGLRLDLDADTDVYKEGTSPLAGQFTFANSEYLSVASNSTLQWTGTSATIEAWIYSDGLAANRFVVAKGSGGAGSEFEVSVNASGNVSFSIYGTPANRTISTNNTPIAAAGWHHIRAWLDLADNFVRLQVDNGTIFADTVAVTVNVGTLVFNIGARNGALFWNGRIALVRFWKRVLTQTENDWLFNAWMGRTYAEFDAAMKVSLQSAWNIDEASGSRADSHGTNTLTDNATVTSNPGVSAIAAASNGDVVRYIKDQSGRAQHAAEGTVAKRATLVTGVRNGHSALRFAGAQSLNTGKFDLSNTQAITVYVVGDIHSASNMLLELSENYSSQTDSFIFWVNASSFVESSLKGNAGTTTFLGKRLPAAGRAECVSATFDTSVNMTGRAFVDPWEVLNHVGGLDANGNEGQTTGSENTNVFGNRPLYLGARARASTFATGDLLRLVIYDRRHTTTQRVQVTRYLRDRYALAHATATLVFDGDSLTSGDGPTSAVSPYPKQMIALSANDYNYGNYGISGQQLSEMAARAPANIDPWVGFDQSKSICVIWGGTNDLRFSQTEATLRRTVQAYCAARRAAGWKVVILTMLPRSDAGLPGSFETDRIAHNTWLRANYTGFADALVDVAADSRIGDAGDELDTTYYTSDKVHLNDTGLGVVAALVKPAVEAL